MSLKRKAKCQAVKKAEQQKRMLTGYNAKWRVTEDEKEQIRMKKQEIKDKTELANKGQYEVLYPPNLEKGEIYNERYEEILKKARDVFVENMGGAAGYM